MYYSYYNNIYSRYSRLNESSGDYSGNTKTVLGIKTVPMYVSKLDVVMDVEIKPIVDCVETALAKIITKYQFMSEYIRYNRTMYVLTNPTNKHCIHKTMSVDELGNLWMNVYFIYNELNNDVNRVFGILFHELMHNFLNHLERSERIFSRPAREKLFSINPKLLKDEMTKQNLCMDLEVNLNMVADGVVSKDFWKEMEGMYDEKYMGQTWEEIYNADGDELLSAYKGEKTGDETYDEAIKEIIKALKTLNNPDATEEEKSKAAAALEDAMDKLLGENRKAKMTIRRRLKKLQKTRIKEIGEIGPYLKKVIDDLPIDTKSMSSESINIFKKDVDILRDEMIRCLKEISDTFKCDDLTLKEDINDCMDKLKDGVERINKPSTPKEVADVIEEDVIYAIDKLLADDLKKKELKKERKKKEEERKKKEKERTEREIEKRKKRSVLYKYFVTLKNLSIIHDHERASETTKNLCIELMDIVEPLLEKSIEEITDKDINGYKSIIDDLTTSLRSDMQVLKDESIVTRETEYLDRLSDEFNLHNIKLFGNLTKGLNKTEIGGLTASAIDSIRLIGKLLHTTKKYRPSNEYKTAYKEEYDRLCKIYRELGEKGLRRELEKI